MRTASTDAISASFLVADALHLCCICPEYFTVLAMLVFVAAERRHRTVNIRKQTIPNCIHLPDWADNGAGKHVGSQ